MFKFNPRSRKSEFSKAEARERIDNQKSTITNIGLSMIGGLGHIVLSAIGGQGRIGNQTSVFMYGASVGSHIDDRNRPNVSQISVCKFRHVIT